MGDPSARTPVASSFAAKGISARVTSIGGEYLPRFLGTSGKNSIDCDKHVNRGRFHTGTLIIGTRYTPAVVVAPVFSAHLCCMLYNAVL